MPEQSVSQRDYMRELFSKLGSSKDSVCAAYAQAEHDGIVSRSRNANGMSSEGYATALWEDGVKKGWLGAATSSVAPSLEAAHGSSTDPLKSLSVAELLVLHAQVGEELRERGVVRSANNPTGDLAEYLFCRAFGWQQAPNSERGYDATGPDGTRYQIKGRRIHRRNKSRQLSAIRDIGGGHFDVLAGVLQALTYEGLESAIRQVRQEPGFNLYCHAQSDNDEPEAVMDEAHFVDAVSRNLRRGRCLLVILGDGITENVEGLTEFLQQHAGLHFALVLVQLSFHDLPGADQFIVVPSIPLRTTNIVRGIVQVDDGRVSVVPPPPTTRSEKPTTLSEDEMFAALDAKVPGTSDRLIAFLTACEDLQVRWEVKKTLIVRMTVGATKITPFVVNADGTIDTGYAMGVKHLMRGFIERVAAAVPGASVRETPKTFLAKKSDGSFVSVWELLDNTAGIRAALEDLNHRLLEVDTEGEE